MSPLRWSLFFLAASVTLTWRDNSSNESGFEIHRSSDGPTGSFLVVGTVSANSTGYVDEAVTPGATYAYKVRGFNSAGKSAFSNTVSGLVIPPQGTPPAGPSGVTATVDIPGRLTNFSDRGLVGIDGTKIAGLSVADGSVDVLIRAVGPGIAAAPYLVPDTLADPKLWIKNAAGTTIATNDNWSGLEVRDAAQRAGAFALTVGSRDAAIFIRLAPGTYTAHVSGPNGDETGIVLLEAYEVPPPPEPVPSP